MTTEEIAPWVEKEVIVTVRDGFTYSGSLMETPEQDVLGFCSLALNAPKPGHLGGTLKRSK